MPFDNDAKVDAEDASTLDLGRGAIVLGGAYFNETAYVIIARLQDQKTVLEVRSAKDNVVRFKGPMFAGALEDGRVYPSERGAWVEFVADDGSYRLLAVDLSGKMGVQAIKGVDRRVPMKVLSVSGHPGEARLVWKEGEGKQPFMTQLVHQTGIADTAQRLGAVSDAGVESWSAESKGNGVYLAWVDGDSLVGQAEMRVSFINFDTSDPKLRWTKSMPMKDEHLMEPVFLQTTDGLAILVLKWIDEESTIAQYMVASESVGKPEYFGIFQKGSRIVGAFTEASGRGKYALVRSRTETGWSYQVCEL